MADGPEAASPAEPGWYAGTYDWKGKPFRGPLHWDGESWSFDGPRGTQPRPAVISHEPVRCADFVAAAGRAFAADFPAAAEDPAAC